MGFDGRVTVEGVQQLGLVLATAQDHILLKEIVYDQRVGATAVHSMECGGSTREAQEGLAIVYTAAQANIFGSLGISTCIY